MAGKLGTIWYEVEARTGKLLTAEREVDKAASNMARNFDKVGDSSRGLSTELTGLATAVKGVIAAMALREVANWVQSYNEMSERVKDATNSIEEFEMVQERLRQTAAGTYRAMGEAQEVFIQSSRAIRNMGYSTEEALDIVDSLSYAFVRNATSSDKAQTAMNALVRATNRGTVLTDHWASLLVAVPTILGDIAKATGKTEAEISALGYAGKLSADMLTEGLRASLDENKDAADSMANSLTDASVRWREAITTIASAFEQQTGALDTFTNALIHVANAIETFGSDADKMAAFLTAAETAAASLAAVVAARLAVSMFDSVKAFHAATIGASRKASADLAAAQAAAAAAANDLIKAQAAERAARGLAHHAVAAKALAVAEANATVATKTLTTAISAQAGVLTITQRAAALLSATMATLGGPMGIIMLAGVALWQFAKNTNEAAKELADLKEPLDAVIARMKEMNQLQRDAEVRRWSNALAEAREEVNELAKDAAYMANRLRKSSEAGSETSEEMRAVAQELAKVARGGVTTSEALDALGRRISNVTGISAEARDALLDKVAALDASYSAGLEAQGSYLAVADAAKTLESDVQDAKKSVSELADEMRTGSSVAEEYAAKMNRALEDAADRTHLGKLMRDIRDNADEWKTATKAQLDAAVAAATAMDAFDKQRKAASGARGAVKGLTEAQREAKRAAEEMARGQRHAKDAIEALRERIYQAGLDSKELAQRQAELAVGEYATQEQIEQARALAAELHSINQQQERASKFGDDPRKAIRGDVSPLSGGAFDDQLARYEAEAQLEEERYAAQLERLQEAKELELEVLGGYHELEAQMAEEHAARMAQIEQAKFQTMMAAGEAGFGAVADVMKTAFGEQSAMYKVAFAAQKAFAIAQSLVAIQQGIALAAANPWPMNLAAMASVAAATAGLVGNISGIVYGGRQYGGPAQADKLYRINETGAPEIFNAANGRQYMLPNTRGEVVSNRGTPDPSGSSVVVNLYESKDRAGQVQERSGEDDDQRIIDIWVADLMGDGRTAQALQSRFPLQPHGV